MHGSEYLARGWGVIPLRPHDKRPLIPWKEYETRLPTPQEFAVWCIKYPRANVGIVTGRVSGLIVLDVDGPQGEMIVIQHGLPDTPVVRTGKGRQFYFKHPGEKIPNFARKLPELDLRADGGYVVAPPSIHPNGKVYQWEHECELAELPDWLLEVIFTKPRYETLPNYRIQGGNERDSRKFLRQIQLLESTPTGARNNQLNRSAYVLGKMIAEGKLDRFEAEYALTQAALSIGLKGKEVEATIKSGLTSGMEG